MGWSKFSKDLHELADARRDRAAAKEAARVRDACASFGERCQWIVAVESAPNAKITGRPAAVLPRLDGFATEVRGIYWIADELFIRLKEADSSAAFDVLAEFGLAVTQPPDPVRLVKIQHAVKVLAERSQHLLRVWMVSGEEDREMEAADVAEAAKRLLALTNGS